jgi:transcriptional regulator with XRE-family HTH domain
MQALSGISKTGVYDAVMPGGRPHTREATEFGQRLAEARKRAGLTQQQLADKLGTNQKLITYWERESVGLKADQLAALADALSTTVDELLGRNGNAKRAAGPVGKVRQVFERVSALPRRQQERIMGVVEDLLTAQSAK